MFALASAINKICQSARSALFSRSRPLLYPFAVLRRAQTDAAARFQRFHVGYSISLRVIFFSPHAEINRHCSWPESKPNVSPLLRNNAPTFSSAAPDASVTARH